jgi:hypothetical protein
MRKLVKYIAVLSVITGAAVFASKKEKTKPTTTKPNKGEFVVEIPKKLTECPVLATKPELFYGAEGQKLYTHCAKCEMGVFLPREDKFICTYCDNELIVATLP